MLIKCPNCNTSYKVPGDRIGSKPVKMRCHNCKQIFAVTRRSDSPPTGYEEYTGQTDALPSEFTFLRQAQEEVEKPHPPQNSSGSPELFNEAPRTSGTFVGVPPAARSAPPIPSRPNSAEKIAPDAAQPPPSDPAPSGDPFEIYDSRRSAWENAVPLELEDYAMDTETQENSTTRLAGKLMSLFVAALVFFFFFVGYRNDWSLDFSRLPDQVSLAFSSRTVERLPEAVKSIELQITKKKELEMNDGNELVIISGKAFNNAATPRSNVVLRAAFRDENGAILSSFEAPCGQTAPKRRLSSIPEYKWKALYKKRGKLRPCHLKPESARAFELPLAKPRSGCDTGTCDIEVTAISAEIL